MPETIPADSDDNHGGDNNDDDGYSDILAKIEALPRLLAEAV